MKHFGALGARRGNRWKIERLPLGARLRRARRAFRRRRLLDRLGKVTREGPVTAQDLFPRELVSLAVSLFRNLQTARRNRDGVMLAVDVDFPLQVLLKLG